MPVADGDRSPWAEVREVETLADDWFVLRKYTLGERCRDGTTRPITRFTVHRGDRVAVLLYSPTDEKVVLTRQFRLPVFLRGDSSGALLEVPGGLLDGTSARDAVRREVAEETGYRIGRLTEEFTAYLFPQLSSERVHFFTAEFDARDRVGDGGGVPAEGEDIEVVELPLDEAVDRVLAQETVDAKTLLLLLLLSRTRHRGAPPDPRSSP